ncbi:hypothetical protein VNO77_41366 [Canavalia gladiata]|uniref:Uncharacterized protein n=1 Tax=Canavalia gladiata TaxID=3824 RepID=A0AAN9JZD2_CANGL
MSPPPNPLKCFKNSSLPSKTKISEFFSDENSIPINYFDGFFFLKSNPSLKTYPKVINGSDAPSSSKASVMCKHNHETILVNSVKPCSSNIGRCVCAFVTSSSWMEYTLCLVSLSSSLFDLGFLAMPSLYRVLESSPHLNILLSALNMMLKALIFVVLYLIWVSFQRETFGNEIIENMVFISHGVGIVSYGEAKFNA